MDQLPNFLIIGAQKAGTTSLYYYLDQHPQVYMSPVKEPHFFSYEEQSQQKRAPRIRRPAESVSNLGDYRALFRGADSATARGEASPSYIYSENAPLRIRQLIPNARMIAVLRDPVARAFSNFVHARRDGREPLADFAAAIDAEEQRIRDGWGPLYHYRRKGFYYRQLSRYLELFDRSQLQIFLFEDLMTEPLRVTTVAFRFLGVSDEFQADISEKHNVSTLPKHNVAGTLYGALRKNSRLVSFAKKALPSAIRGYVRSEASEPLRLSPEVRSELVGAFREDVLRLQQLIGRDLSFWLE
jgi:hypothetical protein